MPQFEMLRWRLDKVLGISHADDVWQVRQRGSGHRDFPNVVEGAKLQTPPPSPHPSHPTSPQITPQTLHSFTLYSLHCVLPTLTALLLLQCSRSSHYG
jgi:hypothetical protein